MAKTQAFAGVVLFDKSPEDLKVIDWACKYLSVSKEYRLCIIHVTELNDTNPPRERTPPAQRYKYDEIEYMLNEAGYQQCDIGGTQDRIVHVEKAFKKKDVKKYIWGIEYKGENFQRTLQDAIYELQPEGLNILVLRWSKPDDPQPQRTPVNRLESKGCSIVLANVDSCPRNVLTLAMDGAGAGAGDPPVDDKAAAGVPANPSGTTTSPAAAATSSTEGSAQPTTATPPAPPMAIKEGSARKNHGPKKTDPTQRA